MSRLFSPSSIKIISLVSLFQDREKKNIARHNETLSSFSLVAHFNTKIYQLNI